MSQDIGMDRTYESWVRFLTLWAVSERHWCRSPPSDEIVLRTRCDLEVEMDSVGRELDHLQLLQRT